MKWNVPYPKYFVRVNIHGLSEPWRGASNARNETLALESLYGGQITLSESVDKTKRFLSTSHSTTASLETNSFMYFRITDWETDKAVRDPVALHAFTQGKTHNIPRKRLLSGLHDQGPVSRKSRPFYILIRPGKLPGLSRNGPLVMSSGQ